MKPRHLLLLGVLAVAGSYLLVRDDELSTQSKALIGNSAQQTGDSNAFMLLMGLDSAGDIREAEVLGRKRLDAYQAWLAKHPGHEGLGNYEVLPPFQPPIQSGLLCDIDKAGCFESLRADGEQVDQLLLDSTSLITRYTLLLATRDYRTLLPPSASAPIPNFVLLRRAQQVYHLSLLSLAEKNTAPLAYEALQRELDDLRMQLAKADNLPLKMLWGKMVSTNLQWQALLARRFGVAVHPVQLLSNAERSLGQAIRMEFLVTADASQRTAHITPSRPGQMLATALLFKQNRTLNALAPRYEYIGELSELAPETFAQAVLEPQPPLITDTGWTNSGGNAILRIEPPDYLLYAARLQDLDSRITLLNKVAFLPESPSQVDVDRLAASNPYYPGKGPRLRDDGRVCFEGPRADDLGGRCLRL